MEVAKDTDKTLCYASFPKFPHASYRNSKQFAMVRKENVVVEENNF